ncbi:MAG: hypothetical protein NVSMB42_23780 [Herpetosiphon sp.]
MAARWLQIQRQATSVLLFVRFSLFGFTLFVAMLGAATGLQPLSGVRLMLLGLVALAFHIFAYVLNDIIDLPIDRTGFRRRDYPLVRGSIKPWQAWVIVLLQVPLAFGLTAGLRADWRAFAVLAVGLGLMVVYDVWGKRSGLPPVTDIIQALAWVALAVYGSLIAIPSQLTPWALVTIAIFVIYINGVHGSLRDLQNDFATGSSTTAIMFGVRPLNSSSISIPRRFNVYVLALQLAFSATMLLPLTTNRLNYAPRTWLLMLVLMLALHLMQWLLIFSVRSGNWPLIYRACLYHMNLALLSVIVLYVPLMDRGLLLAFILGLLVSNRYAYRVLTAAMRLTPTARIDDLQDA